MQTASVAYPYIIYATTCTYRYCVMKSYAQGLRQTTDMHGRYRLRIIGVIVYNEADMSQRLIVTILHQVSTMQRRRAPTLD